MADELSTHPLTLALSAAVPLHLLALQARGGPTPWDVSQAREVAALLGAQGDVLQYGSPTRGECAAVFNRLAHALAVLAWCPGGCTAFGRHGEAAP